MLLRIGRVVPSAVARSVWVHREHVCHRVPAVRETVHRHGQDAGQRSKPHAGGRSCKAVEELGRNPVWVGGPGAGDGMIRRVTSRLPKPAVRNFYSSYGGWMQEATDFGGRGHPLPWRAIKATLNCSKILPPLSLSLSPSLSLSLCPLLRARHLPELDCVPVLMNTPVGKEGAACRIAAGDEELTTRKWRLLTDQHDVVVHLSLSTLPPPAPTMHLPELNRRTCSNDRWEGGGHANCCPR